MGVVPDLRAGVWHFTSVPQMGMVDAIYPVGHLDKSQQIKLEQHLDKAFSGEKAKIGCTPLVSHRIRVHEDPIKQRYYFLSPTIQKLDDQELDQMLADGVVEESSSPWCSPVVMVKKRDGKYRFRIDFRKVNAVTEKDAYSLSYMSSILDKLTDARFLTTIDIEAAYWQLPLEE